MAHARVAHVDVLRLAAWALPGDVQPHAEETSCHRHGLARGYGPGVIEVFGP